MDEQRMNEQTNIPYIAYEAAQSRLERIIKRLWIMCIVLVLLLVGTNVAWLIYEAQFQYYEELEVTQENSDGDNNFIGNDGDITYGQADGSNP